MFSRIFLVFFFNFISLNQAMALTISPDKPVVAIGQRITLTANGATGNVRWQAFDGSIPINSGNQITYIAPDKAGLDSVTAIDEKDSVTAKIVITQLQSDISSENAVWEVFTNRDKIQALLLSEDKKTLWVGTNGGLEQRDIDTGQLIKLFTTLDGLPSSDINSVISDNKGGMWIGTYGGLVHRDNNGKQTVFSQGNAGLPSRLSRIGKLLLDNNGGLWVGTVYAEGIAYRSVDEKWTVFNQSNSSLPNDWVDSFLDDGNGGVWLATRGGGLVHFDSNGKKTIYNKNNSQIPSNYVSSLLGDGNGGIWVGTWDGLAYFDKNKKWTVFNIANSGLLDNNIKSLLSDGKDGIWIGTSEGGLIHRDSSEKWTMFNKNNSRLPDDFIATLLSDGGGGIWVGTYKGLAHLDVNGKWKIFENNSKLSRNAITSLSSDGHGGILIGTSYGGINHYDINKQWTIFDKSNSTLPSNSISSLTIVGNNVWIGCTDNGGLARYNTDGNWTIFNTANSELPSNYIYDLLSDGKGGAWVGTYNGLAHFDVNEKWTVFNKDNSGLPDNNIHALLDDKKGGVWIGTSGGLTHLNANRKWITFNEANSGLPSMFVFSLLSDGNDGIWVGTSLGGLAHFDKNGQWTVFNKENSGLPDSFIYTLLDDDKGGVWVGTNNGLAHLDKNGSWVVFDQTNSGLPDNRVESLLSDGNGGLWVGTGSYYGGGGLAHLTFTNKTALCQQGTQQDCSALQYNQRGAILISGGGSESSNTLWDTTYSINNSIYKILHDKGFNNDEIYYLSPMNWADFNGDGKDDRIVDAPKADRAIESGDIQKALDWAKQRGKLDQPLYIFFIDHGGVDKLQLSKDNTLSVEQFKQMLDDYQTMTGNEVVLVIDACFSGVLGEKLKADKRAIITSTSNSYAYFNRLDRQGFSTFLTKGLSKGMNFNEAFSYATTEQTKLLNKMDLRVVVTGSTGSNSGAIEQIPRKFDGNQLYSLDKLFLNGSFVTGDATLSVKNITTSTQIKANTPISLKAQASVAQGDVKEVWAVVRPPRMDLILDSYNTPILAFPRVILSPTNTNNEWEGTLSDTRYNGDYKITFYAKDKDGDVVSSDDTITLTVSDGIEPPPQATLQIQLNQANYKVGDLLKATITEELQWGYDLYLAVILPDKDSFVLLNDKTNFSPSFSISKIGDKSELLAKWKWQGKRQQGIANPFLELTLPALPAGQYCVFGVLSPQDESVFNTVQHWKTTQQCFIMN